MKNESWQMNMKNSEIVKLDIWRKFESNGQLFYVEIFHYTDGTIQAFANKRPGKVQHLSEEFPIGIGRDDHNQTDAAIQAIINIQHNHTSIKTAERSFSLRNEWMT
jgi:hypothetical protein